MLRIAISSVLLATVTLCAAQNEEGFYLGVGLGGTAFADNDMIEDTNKELGVDFKLNDTSGGVILYGGYKFNNIISAELAYNHYGTFDVKEPAYDYKLEFSPTSFSASANLGYGFLDGQLRPYVLLGLSYIDLDEWVSDDKGAAIHLGFGIQYDPHYLDGFGFRLGYEGDSFGVESDESRTTYVEENYAQGVGILYIGAHYLF